MVWLTLHDWLNYWPWTLDSNDCMETMTMTHDYHLFVPHEYATSWKYKRGPHSGCSQAKDVLCHECTSLFPRPCLLQYLPDYCWAWPTEAPSEPDSRPLDISPCHLGWPASRARCYSVPCLSLALPSSWNALLEFWERLEDQTRPVHVLIRLWLNGKSIYRFVPHYGLKSFSACESGSQVAILKTRGSIPDSGLPVLRELFRKPMFGVDGFLTASQAHSWVGRF